MVQGNSAIIEAKETTIIKSKNENDMSSAPHRFLDKRFPNLKRNIFVITYGRSGSTLLQRLLMTIPGCCIRGENHNIIECIWNATVRAKKAKRVWSAEGHDPGHPWYGSDQIKPMLFAQSMLDGFVQNVLCPPSDCHYFGFKEIRYNSFGDDFTKILDFMRYHFKDPLFIFNTRDGAAVAQSAWWKNWKRDDVVSLVNSMDQRFIAYHEANPECTVLLSYEEFSTNPEALRPIFEILGESFEEERIREVLATRLLH